MLKEKYGDEELSSVIREEELEIIRGRYEAFINAKNRFAALKGTVLDQQSTENYDPPTVSACRNFVTSIPKESPQFNQPDSPKAEPIPLIYIESATTYYPYAMLLQGRTWPSGIDPARREQYLSPEEFENIFKMPLSVFNKLDNHKKLRLKKEAKLF